MKSEDLINFVEFKPQQPEAVDLLGGDIVPLSPSEQYLVKYS
jgi:hypothetical protein